MHFLVFHVRGWGALEFPTPSLSFPPPPKLCHNIIILCIILFHPKWHQVPHLFITKTMIVNETLLSECILICNVSLLSSIGIFLKFKTIN